MRCPTCRRAGYDVLDLMRQRQVNEAAFLQSHPRVHCPACRKRLSPRYNHVDASCLDVDLSPVVRMSCHHCGHHFELAKM